MRKYILLIGIFLFVSVGFAVAHGQQEAAGTQPQKKKPVHITFTVMNSGTYNKAAESIKARFQKRTGIDVTVAAFPWATLRQKNTTDLVSGAGSYDIMSGSYYLASVYSDFIPLDKYIKKYDFGNGLLSGMMQKSEHFHGHQIGLPYGPDAYGYLYRKDLFDQAGLKWPHTWAQFLKMLPELKKIADAHGMATIAFAGGAPEQAPALFLDKYTGSYITKDKKYQLQTTKAINALKEDQTILKYMASDFMGMSINDANSRFLDGKALMLVGWPSFVVADADNPNKSQVVGKWALGKDFTPGRPWLSLWQMYISKYSKHPEAAFKWAMAFINARNDKLFYQKYGIGPEFKSTYHDTTLLKKHADEFNAESYNISRAVNPPLSGQAQDFLASTLGEFFLGKLSPQQVVERVNKKWATIPVPDGLIGDAKETHQIQE